MSRRTCSGKPFRSSRLEPTQTIGLRFSDTIPVYVCLYAHQGCLEGRLLGMCVLNCDGVTNLESRGEEGLQLSHVDLVPCGGARARPCDGDQRTMLDSASSWRLPSFHIRSTGRRRSDGRPL